MGHGKNDMCDASIVVDQRQEGQRGIAISIDMEGLDIHDQTWRRSRDSDVLRDNGSRGLEGIDACRQGKEGDEG